MSGKRCAQRNAIQSRFELLQNTKHTFAKWAPLLMCVSVSVSLTLCLSLTLSLTLSLAASETLTQSAYDTRDRMADTICKCIYMDIRST